MAEPQETQLPENVPSDFNQNSQETKPHNASKVKSDIPIEHWERLLLGKKMVGPDAPEDPATFKRSDLPEKHQFHPGHSINRRLDRLNVCFDNTNTCFKVYYG